MAKRMCEWMRATHVSVRAAPVESRCFEPCMVTMGTAPILLPFFIIIIIIIVIIIIIIVVIIIIIVFIIIIIIIIIIFSLSSFGDILSRKVVRIWTWEKPWGDPVRLTGL